MTGEDTASGGQSRAGRLVRLVGPPLLVFLGFLGLWLVVTYEVLDPSRRFLLPPPQDVVRVGLMDAANRAEVLEGLLSTTEVALVGLAAATVVGCAFAVLMSQRRWIERSFYPYAVALQTIPILAMVPLIGFWLGFNFRSRALVCALIAVFPIITNTLFGIQSADPALHDLFTLHRASRFTRLRKLQLPAALPAILIGLRISAGLSVIGAIVGDFFFRQGEPGIGRLIDLYRARLQGEQLLTAIFLSSLLGLVVFWTFGLLYEIGVGKWHESRRTAT